MDWFDHWQAILAVIVAIGTPIVAMLVWSKPLLHWFGSFFKARSIASAINVEAGLNPLVPQSAED